jgi:hypothetical protein
MSDNDSPTSKCTEILSFDESEEKMDSFWRERIRRPRFTTIFVRAELSVGS